jgi:seryl-tRNA synthetase
MLDRNALTADLEGYAARLARRKGGDLDLQPVGELNERRKTLQKERDELVHEQRGLGPEIGKRKKAGEDCAELQERSGEIKKAIKAKEESSRQVEAELEALLLVIPNLPHAECPEGGEADGVITEVCGEKPSFDFEPQDHVAICDATGLVELGETATRLAGKSFVVYMGQGARLARALINFFLDLHTTEHDYTEVSVPFLVNRTTITGTGQLPKFEDDLYRIESDDLFLIPTAEVPVTNLFQDTIIAGDQLPMGYCAYTPCFRREAGAAGKLTRGLKRLHQFDKVELVRFVRPEESDAEHQRLLGHARTPLDRLGLHYRIKELAAGDIGFAAARCYDIEAYAPGSDEWLEVSSCSTFTDFQARRAKIRFKDKVGVDGGKPKKGHVHTLNASGLALPRVIVALLETNQRADGKIDVPAVLRPYLGGAETLG